MVLLVKKIRIEHTYYHQLNYHFIYSDLDDDEDSVKIEVFHYVYFGENKSLGYVNKTSNKQHQTQSKQQHMLTNRLS